MVAAVVALGGTAVAQDCCSGAEGGMLDGVFFLVTQDLLDADGMTAGLYGYPTLDGVPIPEYAFILGKHVHPDQLLRVEQFLEGEQWEDTVRLCQKWIPPLKRENNNGSCEAQVSQGELELTLWYVFFDSPVLADGVVIHYELPRPILIDGLPTGEYRTTGTVSFAIACEDLCLSCMQLEVSGDPQADLARLKTLLESGACDSFLLPFVPVDPPGEGHVGFM
jgi:hypothetical protein